MPVRIRILLLWRGHFFTNIYRKKCFCQDLLISDPDPAFGSGSNPDPEFWRPNIEKNVQLKKFFWIKNCHFTYPNVSIKDVQATGKDISPNKRTSNTSKQEILHCSLFLWVIFALLDPHLDPADQNQCGSGSETLAANRITINNFGLNIYHTHLLLVRIQASNWIN